MFKFKNYYLYVPIIGPISYSNIQIFPYQIKLEKKIKGNEEYKQFKIGIKNCFQDLGYFVIQDEDLLISVSSDISEDKKVIIFKNNKVSLECKTIPDVKIPTIIVKVIHEIFLELIKPDLYCKVFQDYLLTKDLINEGQIRELKVQLYRFKAIRYSIYIDNVYKQFLILIYPSFKLLIEPTVDQFILNEIDIKNLNVISKRPKFPAGTIIDVIKKPDPLIKQEINRLNREIDDNLKTFSINDPIIKLKTPHRTRDQYYPAIFYNIQAMQDDELFKEILSWDTGNIQNSLQFNPKSFYKNIEPFREKFESSIKKIMKINGVDHND
ncbi:MAG: hypothetical protein ACTSVV_06125 [Promethearchaeota archaeon]